MKLKQILALMFVVAMLAGSLNSVLAVAPGAAHKLVATTTSTPYIFQVNDFGYSHPPATPAHLFDRVRISEFGVSAANNNGAAIFWRGELQQQNSTGTWNTLAPATNFTPVIPVSDIQAGRLRFVPAAGETGQPYTAFSFQNIDDNGTPSDANDDLSSNNYRMTINVNAAANRAPDAVNDNATVAAGQNTTILVLSNDSDPDGNALSIVSVTQPANGAVSILSGTTPGIAYRSNAGFTGTDAFTYTISDGSLTDTATVAVAVGQPASSQLLLQIERIKINGKTSGELLLDEDNEIEVEIKNNLNVDLNDVEVTVIIRDVDGDDLDEDAEIDIDSQDKETVEFTFDLTKEKLDKDRYTIEVKVEGTDRNNVRYTDTETVTVDVDREKHQVVIQKASLDRSSVACSAQSVNLLVRIENVGKNDEDDVEIRVFNENLDLDLRRSNIELEDFESNDNDYQVTIPLDIQDAEPGEEVIRVEVLRDGTVDDREDVTLTVNCNTRTKAADSDLTAGKDLINEIKKGLEARKTGSETEVVSIRDGSSYLVLLGILAGLAFTAVVLALAVLITRKKK